MANPAILMAATAAAQGIGGAIDNRWNRKMTRENVDKTIAAQKAEAELAYQRSVEMWNKQNEYNSPAAQMERFKSAGLNPHLIYGQGSPGNAGTPPQYQPANIQYRYAPMQYGETLQSIIPALMEVGSWMQDMRMKEVGIQKSLTDTERTDQMIKFLEQQNPQLLEEKRNKLTLFPYQAQMLGASHDKIRTQIADMSAKFRQEYGEDLWRTTWIPGSDAPIGGIARLKYLQEEAATRLKQAQASWSDFDITNPQAIVQLVLSGIMGMAGSTLKLSNVRRSRPTTTHEVSETMRSGRVRTRRRIYQSGN